MSDGSDSGLSTAISGDDLLQILGALASPHRLRVLAALARERRYVSQLARELGIGRPLLHLHLRRLEEAGLVRGSLELSEDGRAMKFYELTPFQIQLTPETITAAAASLRTAPGLEIAVEDNKEGTT